jgi:6-phosphogluconolactonase
MFAYVGGYTTPDRDGRGNGINVYRIDEVNGAWSHIQHVGGLENPALFTLTRDQSRLYTVHGGRNLISAFAVCSIRSIARATTRSIRRWIPPNGSW